MEKIISVLLIAGLIIAAGGETFRVCLLGIVLLSIACLLANVAEKGEHHER